MSSGFRKNGTSRVVPPALKEPQLQNSSYGRFQQYLVQCGLHTELQQDFQLPRVIVVGARSAGKSSLLESITKCPIFPRHRDVCTKMPLQLRLKNVPSAIERKVTISYPGRQRKLLQKAEDILAEVDAIMQSVKGIDAQPIVIEICQVGLLMLWSICSELQQFWPKALSLGVNIA